MESAAASVGCCGSAVSFWSSRRGFEGITSWLCPALFPPQEPGGAAWVTAWHLEQRRVVQSPDTAPHSAEPWGCQVLSPWYSWTRGLLGLFLFC